MICEERMENVEVFKYLGVWFDKRMRGKCAFGEDEGKGWGTTIGCIS